VRARVQISKRQVKTIKSLGLAVVVRRCRRDCYVDLPFRLGHGADIKALTEAILAVIMKVLQMLFGIEEVRYYTALDLSQSKIEHGAGKGEEGDLESDQEKIYDATDIQACMQQVEKDAKRWQVDSDIDGIGTENALVF